MPLDSALADDLKPPSRPRPERAPAPRHRRAYAALDLGTNNCRLLIARPTRGGFYVIDAYSRIVRLGEGLMETGLLSDTAQARAIEALKACADKIGRRQVWVSRNVATEACRRARNGHEFVDRVYQEAGLALDVITPEEEAKLAVIGCEALFEPGLRRALVFDIGGGSTEIVLVELNGPHGTIAGWTSVPWGVVSLTETEDQHLETADAREQAFVRMRARVAEYLGTVRELTDPAEGIDGLQLLGTSGTITTLASLQLGLAHYDRRKVDGCWVAGAELRDISLRLARMAHGERAAQQCIGDERADLIVAGCAILDAILEMFPAERVRVADRGIREGVLRTLMRRDGHRF